MSKSSTDSLTIGQVARQAKLNPSAVRYYERIGLLAEPERVGGWRRYDPGVLDRLKLLSISTACGFSLEETRILLEAMDREEGPQNTLAQLSHQKIPELEVTLARTQLMLQLLRSSADCSCPTLRECAERAEEAGI